MLAVDGRPKAWARDFQRLAETLAQERIAPAPLGPRPTLDWDRCRTDPGAGRDFLQRYGESFKAQYDPR